MREQNQRVSRFNPKRFLAGLVLVFFLFIAIAFLALPQFSSLARTTKASVASVADVADVASVADLAPTPTLELVGANCKGCHSAVVASFQSEIHGKSAKFSEGHMAASCDSCHGNTDKHVEIISARDRVSPVAGKQVVFNGEGEVTRISPAEVNQSCLKCHSQDRSHENWYGGEHDRANVSCISCHSVHNSQSPEGMLSRPNVEDSCMSCHTSVRKAVHQRSTHLIRSEHQVMKVGCNSCHNPHGGEADKMLVAETVNNTCYQCHAEKRGPFLWEHPPARENCMSCHSAHGSNNAKLLVQRASQSCQQCHIHMLPRHSTTAGKPLDIWTLNRGCVNCHNQIHGSNHPGGRTFTR